MVVCICVFVEDICHYFFKSGISPKPTTSKKVNKEQRLARVLEEQYEGQLVSTVFILCSFITNFLISE